MRWFSFPVAVLASVFCLPSVTRAEPAAGSSARLIVIDPGHGGANTGAPAVAGGYEKQQTLVMAREIERKLSARGFRVVLTRDRDEYLTLRQRVRIANALGADLLVSIHLNASQSHGQRGYETFILSPDALDVDTRALRHGDGAPHLGVDRKTAVLLDDIEQGLAVPAAAEVATAIQSELRKVRGADGDRGVRQESMHVLLGATMPAVLVEAGFIDHPREGRELVEPEVRDAVTSAIADGIASALER